MIECSILRLGTTHAKQTNSEAEGKLPHPKNRMDRKRPANKVCKVSTEIYSQKCLNHWTSDHLT